jgi:hypothetical protein
VVFVAENCSFVRDELGEFEFDGDHPDYVDLHTTVAGSRATATLTIEHRADAVSDEAVVVTIVAPDATVIVPPQSVTLDLRAEPGLEYYVAIGAVIVLALVIAGAAIRAARRARNRT